MDAKFLSDEKKELLQKVSSLYFKTDVNENIEAGGNFKTIKGTLGYPVHISKPVPRQWHLSLISQAYALRTSARVQKHALPRTYYFETQKVFP